jgi:hypothetical protein
MKLCCPCDGSVVRQVSAELSIVVVDQHCFASQFKH